MNITSKSRYGLKIMMDLAQLKTGHAQRGDISERQGIPLDYMDHILVRLRERGLILSIRGRGGGYKLNQKAEDISVWNILEAVEEHVHPVQCLEDGSECGLEHFCGTRDAWSEIAAAIKNSLSGIRLSDLVAKNRHKNSLLKTKNIISSNLARQPDGLHGKMSANVVEPLISESDTIVDAPLAQECRAPRRRAGGTLL